MRATGREVGVFGGAWRERRVDSAGRRVSGRLRAAKGDLYIFVQATGPDAPRVELEIARLLADAYYQAPARSVTTSLTRALAVANEELCAANEQSSPADRHLAAAMCLVLRDGEVYLAQAGPSLAYYVLPDAVQLLGRSTRLPAPLGADPELDAELLYQPVEDDCSLVLAAESLLGLAPPTALRQLLVVSDDLDVALALRALLRAHTDGQGARALVVDVEAPKRPPAPPPEPEPTELPAGEEPEEIEPEAGLDDGSATPTEPAEEVAAEDELALPAGPRLGDRIVARLARARASLRNATSTTPRLIRTLIVAAMALLAIFAAVVVPIRLWQDRQAGITDLDLLAQAEERERQALTAGDSGQRLALLLEAGELAGRAERAARLRREGSSAPAVARRIQQEVDRMSGAVRFGQPARFIPLEGRPQQLVLGGGDLYVLDRAVDRVYRYALAADGLSIKPTATPGVFRRGDRFGDVVARAPSRLVWMPAGSGRASDALLVVDEAGALFELDPIRGARPLRSSAPWRPTQHLFGYAGCLFVLDSLAGLLERHQPGPDGYDRAAYSYFPPDVTAPLADGVGLAVDADLYLLRSSGRIDRFAQGRPQPFAGAVPGRPLSQPASLLTAPSGLYVLDYPNRRLVQFDRAGAYQRQYLFDGKDDVLGVAVDEPRGLLYYLGKQGIGVYRLVEPSDQPTPSPSVGGRG